VKPFILSLFLLLTLTPYVYGQGPHDVIWMTEEYPPLNYSENQVRKGQFVEILLQIWKKVGIEKSAQEIQILPWARAYLQLQTIPNTALFAMNRTPGREKKFKWVGPVSLLPLGIIANKGKQYKFKSMEEVNGTISKGRLGVVRSDSGEHHFLEQNGDSTLLHRVTAGEQLVKMLDRGRFDAISYLHNVVVYNMKKSRINTHRYELVYALTKNNSGWFGFHKDTPQKTIDIFQQAFDELTTQGVIDKIGEAYLE